MKRTFLRRPQFIKLVSFALLIVFTVSCKQKQQNKVPAAPQKPPVPKVDVYIVKYSPFAESIELPGSLVANETTGINPEISGRLISLNIREGMPVSKGALLAKIYDGDLKAQLQKLQTQLKVQEQTAKRYEELLKINGVSQQEYDMIVLQSNNIKADIDIVQSNIQRTEIRAPFSGTLGLKMVSPGAFVSPQTTISTLQQTSMLKLDFSVPERYSSKITVGQHVGFMAEGSNKKYSATISAIEPGVSEDNRSLRVRCTVTNKDAEIMPGKFAKVLIGFDADPEAILIPSYAVIPQARGKKAALLRDGTVSMEDISTSGRDSARVQVLSGLKPGDTLILTGLMALKPGGKVDIRKVID